jgi:tetratricopeptide (TPR) repeat protein
VYDLLSKEILKSKSELARFSGIKQDSIKNQFIEYDNHLKMLQQEKIAWLVDQVDVPEGRVGARVSEYTELALINKEKKNYKKAIESLSRMYDMDKTNARLVYELAECYKLDKEYEKGMSIIKRYIESGYSNNMVTELYDEFKKIMS